MKIVDTLEDLEACLKNANTPKPYEFNLIQEIYLQETEEFWKEYQEKHPYIIFNFISKDGKNYKLADGKLVL